MSDKFEQAKENRFRQFLDKNTPQIFIHALDFWFWRITAIAFWVYVIWNV